MALRKRHSKTHMINNGITRLAALRCVRLYALIAGRQAKPKVKGLMFAMRREMGRRAKEQAWASTDSYSITSVEQRQPDCTRLEQLLACAHPASPGGAAAPLVLLQSTPGACCDRSFHAKWRLIPKKA
eukprot:814280-Alexandrium_andersonii.AAC.1